MALPTATQVRIYNRALALLGSVARVNNVNDGQTATETFNELWPAAVREVQAEHPWNCCVEYATLNRGAAQAQGGYAYQLPADCLRWLPWAADSEHWFEGEEKKGKVLLADEGTTLFIRYIALNETVFEWPPHLVSAMAYRLAMDAAEAITQSEGIKEKARVAYEGEDGEGGALAKAKRADGLATGDRNRGNVVTLSRTLSAGFGTSRCRAPGR